MIIRNETKLDHKAIEALTYSAFQNHPHHEIGAMPTEHLIINKLREAGALTLSLVVEAKKAIIGHIAFSPIAINGVIQNWYGLGPVSVSIDRQGEGLGSMLIKKGLSDIKKLGAEGVVLLGEPAFYNRFGFYSDERLKLTGVPPDFFLVNKLNQKKEMPVGEVTYHQAFG